MGAKRQIRRLQIAQSRYCLYTWSLWDYKIDDVVGIPWLAFRLLPYFQEALLIVVCVPKS